MPNHTVLVGLSFRCNGALPNDDPDKDENVRPARTIDRVADTIAF